MPLKVSQGMGAWIDDFKKSDAPQFKGKSDKERRDQAIAAYLDAKRKAKSEGTDEGYVSHAQRKAVWASRNEKGKKESVEEKVDRDALAKAMAAYKAKGGKVTKAPAAKAQGYHGKDDPGAGMHGMLDKPDTKKIGTRKKVKSMEDVDENYQVQKYTDGKKDGPPKSFGGNLKKATAHANKMGGDHRVHKEAKRKDKPPFDNAKPVNKDPKDKFGNPIKNRAKHLARKAARDLVNKQKNESSYSKLNKYNKDAQASKDKATNSAVATILRKGDHSKDLNTMRKREKGLKMVKSRITDKIRKGHKANEGTVNELSPDTKKSYTKKATTDLYGRGLRKGMDIERGSSSLGRTKVVDKDNDRKIKNRHAGIYRAQK